MTFRKSLALSLATLGTFAVLPGCTATPKNETAAANQEDASRTTLRKFQGQDKSLANVLDTAAGYAVFSSVGKAGFIVGGAYGKGVVYQQGQVVGFADIKQASIGFQAGGQDYDELVIFRDPAALERFKRGSYALSAEVSAVALKAGAAAQADFKQGVAVFTMTNSGLMAEAAVAGQKFGFTPSDAAPTPSARDRAMEPRSGVDVRTGSDVRGSVTTETHERTVRPSDAAPGTPPTPSTPSTPPGGSAAPTPPAPPAPQP